MANSLLDSIFNNDDLWKPQQAPQEDGSAPIQTGHGQIVDSVTNLLANIGEGALHALPDTVGFVGDLLNEGAKIRRGNFSDIHLPGTGKVAQSVDKSFDLAEDKYTHGQTPTPHNKAERYAHDVSEGVASTLVGGGPDAALPAIAAGTAGPVAGDLTFDLTGNEALARVAGLAGMVLGGFTPHIVNSIQNARTIGAGASHPDFGKLVRMVEDREGGGTLAHPAVNPKSGAMGPMQVTPETARDPGYGIRPWNGKDQADLARVGRQKLAALLGKYNGDTEKAFAAYNWGEGHVDSAIHKYGDNWLDHAPPETQHYVEGVEAPDGLPGNSSVRPMNPSDIASAMNDPEAALAEVASRDNDLLHAAPDAEDLLDDHAFETAVNRYADETGLDPEAIKDHYYSATQLDDITHEINARKRDALAELTGPGGSVHLMDDYRSPTIDESRPHLTPAETQEMDASVPKPNPPEAVDARAVGRGADYPEQVPANDAKFSPLDINDDNFFVEKEGKNYGITYHAPNGAKITADLVHKGNGIFDMDIGGIGTDSNTLGPAGTRQLLRAIKDKIPELKEINAQRITGARGENPLYTSIKVPEIERDPNPPAASSITGATGKNASVRETPRKSEAGHESPNILDVPMNPEAEKTSKVSIAEEKLANAINAARPASIERRSKLHEVRVAQDKRLREIQARGGSVGEMKAALKGKVPFGEWEPLDHGLTENEKDLLREKINHTRGLGSFDRLHAHEALEKLLNERGMETPTESELKHLTGIFGPKLVRAIRERVTPTDKPSFAAKLWNTVNAAKTIGDLSDLTKSNATMFLTPGYWSTLGKLIKGGFFTRGGYERIRDLRRSHPDYDLVQKMGISHTGAGEALGEHEEIFKQNFLEHIPGVSHISQISERVYSGVANEVRDAAALKIIARDRRAGIDVTNQPYLRNVGELVNTLTGRSTFGKTKLGVATEKAMPFISKILWTPRQYASWFKMTGMAVNPRWWLKATPGQRRMMASGVVSLAAWTTANLTLASTLGYEVHKNVLDPLFGKYKVGDTTYDASAGRGSTIHAVATALSGELFKNGAYQALGDKNAHSMLKTRGDVVMHWMRTHASPAAALIENEFMGKDLAHPVDAVGNEEDWHNWKDESINPLYKALMPMSAEGTVEAAKHYGKTSKQGYATGVLDAIGIQSNTLEPRPPKGTSDPFKYDSVDDVFNDESLWGPTQ